MTTQPDQDDLYDKAVAVFADQEYASLSLLQRHLRIGYNRAARLIESMQANGVLAEYDRNGRIKVLKARKPK